MEVLAQKAVQEKDGSVKLETVCHWVESNGGEGTGWGAPYRAQWLRASGHNMAHGLTEGNFTQTVIGNDMTNPSYLLVCSLLFCLQHKK